MVLCPNKYCRCVSSNYQAVESSILSAMRDWSENIHILFQEFRPLTKEKPDFYRNTIDALSAEISALEARMEKCYTFLETGLYSPDEFKKRRDHIANDIAERKESYKVALTHLGEIEQIQNGKIIYLPMVRNALELYGRLESAQEKHDLLASVLEKVEYSKLERNKKFEYDVEKYALTVFPRLPK